MSVCDFDGRAFAKGHAAAIARAVAGVRRAHRERSKGRGGGHGVLARAKRCAAAASTAFDLSQTFAPNRGVSVLHVQYFISSL